jgi:hypothetical protein
MENQNFPTAAGWTATDHPRATRFDPQPSFAFIESNAGPCPYPAIA